MGLLDFLFGTAVVMNILDTRDSKRPRNITPVDDADEAQFDDGNPDDYIGDGLDGTDDYNISENVPNKIFIPNGIYTGEE